RTEPTFALTTSGRVQVRAFIDRDGDGALTPGERAMPVRQATLERAGDGWSAHSQVEGGLLAFPGVPPGEYVVTLDLLALPEGYVPVTSLARPVTVEQTQIVTVDIPLDALRTIGGRVFVDLDDNKRRDPTDPPASRALVWVSAEHQARTDEQGNFLFRRLPEGRYRVHVEGARTTTDVDLSNGPQEELDLEILVDPETLGIDLPRTRRPPSTTEGLDAPLVGLYLVPPSLYLDLRESGQVDARALLVDGRNTEANAVARWRSEDERVARVDESGRVTALSYGETAIRAEIAGVHAFPTPVVVAPPPLELSVEAPMKQLVVGNRARLRSTAFGVDGTLTDATGLAAWSSSHPETVRLHPDGSIAALRPGVATVWAEWRGLTSPPVTIEVLDSAPVSLEIVPPTATLRVAEALPYRAFAVLADGTRLDLTGAVSWSVADGRVASVSAGGILTGRARGTTTLEAVLTGSEKVTATIPVEVVRSRR
ncbi:MAG: Ig-like domain-containing protein, partial [Deltaproteobacteria bacterium]|nr:Ig-like domain-containing protein [Deltaproteobacteria bacterium]